MTTPLTRKFDGKKFLWNGGTYDSPAAAQEVMEGYAKEGFEVQMFEEDGHYLVYSRRVAAAQSAG
jgi:alpha-beta hydrolase superfamily lysophospholipase